MQTQTAADRRAVVLGVVRDGSHRLLGGAGSHPLWASGATCPRACQGLGPEQMCPAATNLLPELPETGGISSNAWP